MGGERKRHQSSSALGQHQLARLGSGLGFAWLLLGFCLDFGSISVGFWLRLDFGSILLWFDLASA